MGPTMSMANHGHMKRLMLDITYKY